MIKLPPTWREKLKTEFDQDDIKELDNFLKAEKSAGKTIFPPENLRFNAFDSTPFDQVKVVILGQDPYHGSGQAHGLSFSVPKGIKIPPSLKNIYKELESDLGIKMPEHGCLQSWAEQGVLLLNATLSVEEAKAGSHQGEGWEQFTDTVITTLNDHREGLVFMLWGSHAQKKGAIIDQEKHLVLKAPHPSPLSAYRGFLGCQHFSQANVYLNKHGDQIINWSISDR
ncbi:MAG: uracil-DNA glycosylase [Gammaproteobacteria bacterium]